MSYGKTRSSAKARPMASDSELAIAALAVTFLMLCAYGNDDKPPSDTAVMAIGLGLIAFLAVLTGLAVRRYFVASLRPTDDGIQIGTKKVAWADVAGLRPAAARFIRVIYAPGHEPTGRYAHAAERLGNVGFYLPPTYLSARYDTRGHGRDLIDVLQRWRSRYYAGECESTDGRIDAGADKPSAQRDADMRR
jgi:hypothetical protein